MMKHVLTRQALALLALSVALAGCPALETGTQSDPKPDPSPSASAPAKDEDQKQEEKEPTFAIKALGPVRAQLEGAIDFEHGPITVYIGYSSSDSGLWRLGSLGTFSTTAPAGTSSRFTPKPGADGVYQADNANGTHYFQAVNRHTHLSPEALSFAIDGIAPFAERREGDVIVLDFPAATRGTLTATPTDSSLRFRKYVFSSSGVDYSFPAIATLPLADTDGYRAATISATVSVQELDGTPSKGLTAANFRLSGTERIAIQATETEAGRYRLVMALDGIYGALPKAQHRMLTVTHATLVHTHTPVLAD